ncbi:hypothetical protein E2C01_085478 [Portunus trituberculatus]|uniref:Uncharacterized protein n=1 Tax=Portunus trituberculatus TaxID=210409 RepID=A0A5B7J6U9_PORTR|nr:hypothetical protein [Portunus trituberculatus]
MTGRRLPPSPPAAATPPVDSERRCPEAAAPPAVFGAVVVGAPNTAPDRSLIFCVRLKAVRGARGWRGMAARRAGLLERALRRASGLGTCTSRGLGAWYSCGRRCSRAWCSRLSLGYRARACSAPLLVGTSSTPGRTGLWGTGAPSWASRRLRPRASCGRGSRLGCSRCRILPTSPPTPPITSRPPAGPRLPPRLAPRLTPMPPPMPAPRLGGPLGISICVTPLCRWCTPAPTHTLVPPTPQAGAAPRPCPTGITCTPAPHSAARTAQPRPDPRPTSPSPRRRLLR